MWGKNSNGQLGLGKSKELYFLFILLQIFLVATSYTFRGSQIRILKDFERLFKWLI